MVVASRSECALGTVVADPVVRDVVVLTGLSLDGDHDCTTGIVDKLV